jgi:hypothetical protein
MDEYKDQPGWRFENRQDGLFIRRELAGWVIVPVDKRPLIRACPCCGAPLRNARAAQIVADAVYPQPTEADPSQAVCRG